MMYYENQLLAGEMLDAAVPEKTIDLREIVPVGKVERKGGACSVFLSVDGHEYFEIEANHARNRTARFVKLIKAGRECVYIALYVGAGYIARRNHYWSDSFKRYEGWTGADGIYSFNAGSGLDSCGSSDQETSTLFYFSDTLVSAVDQETLHRQKPVYMPNNTYALLEGDDPQRKGSLQFYYNYDDRNRPTAVLKPERTCFDFAAHNEDFSKAYFWFQDGVVLRNKLYLMPSLITEDKTQPEGFQFRGLGVVIAEVDLIDGKPDFAHAVQHEANLSCRDEAVNIIYGACFLPWLPEAGYPDGDGYVYIYGHRTEKKTQRRSLCLARVKPEKIAHWQSWRFFDGSDFTADIRSSSPLLDHISCEMSVMPISTGVDKGKFLAVFQYDTKSEYVAYAIGDTPWGPFSSPQKVFYCDEGQIHETVYMYNAKAHPHLSTPGNILASYNVNATSSGQTDLNGHLYLPRFITLHDTSVQPLETLFADAWQNRVRLFDSLNRAAEAGGTVFAGDSLVQEFPVGELFTGGEPIYNRGIGGDTTAGLLRRLRQSVLDLRPARVFLLIGTNDFVINGTAQSITDNLAKIIGIIKNELPECFLGLISLLPVNTSDHPRVNLEAVGKRNNEEIDRVNRQLKSLAGERHIEYIDLNGLLKDEKGNFSLDYTTEGLHVSGHGYATIAAALQPYMAAQI